MTSASHPFLQRVATHGLPAALSWCHEYARRSYSEVQHCAMAGQRKKLRKAVRDAVQSDVVKISCLHRAGYRSKRSFAFLQKAQSIDMGAPFKGEVPWRSIGKSSGGSRVIVSLPILLKARHKMIASLIEAQLLPPEFVYSVRGRGRDSLVVEVLDLLNNGFAAAIRCDIGDCFMNVNPEALTTLPLARGVIENNLFPANLRLVRQVEQENSPGDPRDASIGFPIGTMRESGSAAEPTGLMQGSPASNIAMTYLLRDLSWPLGDDVRVLVYCDDFFIVGRSMEDCRVVEDALAEFLARCSFGPLTLLRKETSESGYFEALGYGFTRYARPDEWSVDLSVKNHDKLEALHEAALAEDERAGFMLPHSGDALVRKRLESFRQVTDRDAIEARYHASGVDGLSNNCNDLRGRVGRMAAERGISSGEAGELALDAAFQHEMVLMARHANSGLYCRGN